MTYRCRFCGISKDVASVREWHERGHIQKGDPVREEFVTCECDAQIEVDEDENLAAGKAITLVCSECDAEVADPNGTVPLAGGAA